MIFWAFLVITTLFVILLLIKNRLPPDFCVLCVSIALTWIGLLILYLSGKFSDQLLLGLLIGQSITGIYYLSEKRAKPWLTFRLPYILTLTWLAYVLITKTIDRSSLLLLLILWFAFAGIYVLRRQPGVKKTVKKIIECCSKW